MSLFASHSGAHAFVPSHGASHAARGTHAFAAAHGSHAAHAVAEHALSRHSSSRLAVAAVTLLTSALCSAGIMGATAPGMIAHAGQEHNASAVALFTPQNVVSQAGPEVSRSFVRTEHSGQWVSEMRLDRLDSSKVSVFVLGPQAYQPASITMIGSSPESSRGMSAPGYPFSQCTWWAAIRRAQLGKPVTNHMGNGADWANSARKLGWKVDHIPSVGAVIVFQRGQLGASPVYGHVAIVEKILPDGSVITSECGATFHGKPFTRRLVGATHLEFIH
jgi:surface antigen